MIDEERTLEIFGYVSRDWGKSSHKKVVFVCEQCGRYRVAEKRCYYEFCRYCILENKNIKIEKICKGCGKVFKVYPSLKYRKFCSKLCSNNNKRLHTEETKLKMSIKKMGENNPFFGKHHSPENVPPRNGENNGMYGRKHTEKSKQSMSAKLQNVPIEEWKGYSKKNKYCNMWTEAVRERVRDEFDRLCFVCDKDEKTNGRKLSVHHIDNDRNQGCDETDWKLVPLCNSCHGKVSHDPDVWERLITNAFNYICSDKI